MASTEPSEDEIDQVITITGLNPVDDRTMVIQALKSNNRNIETVIGQFFDNADNFRRGYEKLWDDTMFGADRDGTANTSGISFHIESPNQNDVIQGVTPPPEGYGPAAPSRPPSRSNNRSPLGRMLDWTAENATGNPNSQAQEDEDMQRALRASAQEAGVSVAEQETGVVNASTLVPYFGPANRDDYDQGNWAMVPTQIQTQVNDAPPPTTRKRANGAPAFLVKGLSTDGSHRLGGLLTILHQIPLARNILLQTGAPAQTYGHNSEWWKGQEILAPHVLAKLQTGELRWGSDEVERPKFEEEIHRLIAFLDQTERAYGTVSVLADLIPWPSLGPEKQFYEVLGERNKEVIQPLEQGVAVALALGDDQGDEEARFGLLDIELQKGDYACVKTLYEAIDQLMWSDVYQWNTMHDESRMAMLKGMGEVMAIKISGDGFPEPIDIPMELYPERWLTSRKDEARRIQRAWCDNVSGIGRINAAKDRLILLRDDSKRQIDKRELIKGVGERWNVFAEFLDGSARYRAMKESGFDDHQYPDYRKAPCQLNDAEQQNARKVEEVLEWTDRALSELDQRIRDLDGQLEQIQAKQRFLGALLTVPDKPARPKPMTCKKFLLRGVATAQDVVYVCERAEADLIELGDKPKELDQWWRLSYTPWVEQQPVKAEKVQPERVLRDMWQETRTPLMVYATEEAVNAPRTPLASALERFVRADNKTFRLELNRQGNEATELKRTGPDDPTSPSKRKHRSDSPDSMDSNRASLGSDGGNAFDDPFADQGDRTGTEIMEMPGERIDVAASVDNESMVGLMDDVKWNGAPGGGTSTTVTPNTLPVEETETSAPGPARRREDESRTMSPEAETVRSPEMQERARPPAFMTLSRSSTEPKQADSMDMEIPDYAP